MPSPFRNEDAKGGKDDEMETKEQNSVYLEYAKVD
jgi:hypothetical protein